MDEGLSNSSKVGLFIVGAAIFNAIVLGMEKGAETILGHIFYGVFGLVCAFGVLVLVWLFFDRAINGGKEL